MSITAQQPPIAQTQFSSPHAEHEPLPSIGKSEWNTLSETSPKLSEEVKEAGVEVVHPTPQVPVQAQVVGVTPAKEETPMVVEEEVVHAPFTLQQAENIIKTDHHSEDSLRWFATLIVREMAIAQMKNENTKNKN